MTITRIDRYMARAFLASFAVILAIIVVLLQTLDLMNQADEVLANEGAGAADMLRYVGWRAPQLADRFIPFVALLAALATLARLGRSSEITAMRAAGMSSLRVLAPLCVAGAGIALVHFAFHEAWVVNANKHLITWQDQDYAPGGPVDDARIRDVRMVENGLVVRADMMAPQGDGWRLDRLRAYSLGAGGMTAALQADSAVHDGAGWTLDGARRFDADSLDWNRLGETDWPEGPAPERLTAVSENPDRMSIGALNRATQGAGQSDYGAPALATALMYRFSSPIASLIMPLLAAVAGFGLHRSKTLLARVAAGVALGFSYFVFENVMVVMGRLDAAPASVAAFAAPVCFFSIGLAMRR